VPARPSTAAPSPSAAPSSAAPTTAAASKAAPSPSASRSHVAAVPRSVSAKKGAATWQFSGITTALKESGVSWYYTWGSGNGGIDAPAGVQFVPMVWGASDVTTGTLDQVRGEGSALLTFNEPDMSSQANMTPQQALALWPKLEATGMELGSPAVATGAATPNGWLDQFMQGARSKGYRVDFIAVHWYGSDFSTPDAVSQLESYLAAIHARYGLPIWLTEYALIDFSGATSYPTAQQQTSFVTASTRMLQSLAYVQRYSWFAFPATTPGQTGMFQPGGAPNTLGDAYEEAGD
jgi:Glycosyl hydrolase catalytic core